MPYRPTDRTRARLAAAREIIVQAAEQQLAEGGCASTSMAAVSRRAGVATGTVYRHFPSRSDLLAEVFRRAGAAEGEALRALASPSEPAPSRIGAWVEAFIRRALDGPVRARALLTEPVDAALASERVAFRRVYADLFAGAVRDGAARGELAARDPEVAATAIVGALVESVAGPLALAGADADALAAEMRALVLSGLASPVAAASSRDAGARAEQSAA